MKKPGKLIPRNPLILVVLSLAMVQAGCTTRHMVTIDPHLPVTPRNLGNSEPVSLEVIDSRPSNIISKWRDGMSVRKFTISPRSNLADTLQMKVSEGLQRLGFRPSHRAPSKATALSLEILKFKSLYREGLPSMMSIQVSSAVRATCRNQNKKHSQVYTSNLVRKDLRPGSFPNESLLNNSLSIVLKRMFSDQNLIGCLAS